MQKSMKKTMLTEGQLHGWEGQTGTCTMLTAAPRLVFRKLLMRINSRVWWFGGSRLRVAGISFHMLLPVLVSWAEWRSGAFKLMKKLSREKLLPIRMMNGWRDIKKNRASSWHPVKTQMHILCQTSVFVPRKALGKSLAFLHLQPMKKAGELGLLFT